MNYETIKEICRVNKISIGTICEEIGITMNGLKRGIDEGGLGIKYVIPLCKALCTTPNRLFGFTESDVFIQSGIGNTQNNKSISNNSVSEKLDDLEFQLTRERRHVDELLKLLANKN